MPTKLADPEFGSETIDLSSFKLEPHVLAAFEVAWETAGTGTITAAGLLRAIVVVARRTKTAAYQQLTSMLPLSDPGTVSKKATKVDVATKDDLTFTLSKELASSYRAAEKSIHQVPEIWGRDVVTIAVLADTDPTLMEIVSEAETTVEDLQDYWFEFVASNEEHRTRQDWERWWQDAGVPMPHERETAQSSTYLFAWDPSLFPEEVIKDAALEIEKSGSVQMKWSTGHRRLVKPEDRVFLVRHGVKPLGLVGAGEIVENVERGPHWHAAKRDDGMESSFVLVRWDSLSVEPLVSRQDLVTETGSKRLWDVQVGGVKLDPEVAAIIEGIWPEGPGDTEIPDALRYASTLSDLDHRNDWIGIRSDVQSLSTLISVNRIEPPLSVAIFGDWGAGKTFLMRKIQERVQILEKIGKKQEEVQAEQWGDAEAPGEAETKVKSPTRYCNSILQIEFNAWHYTESNLWASLVNHIFEKLYDKLTPDVDDREKVDVVERFFDQLETARAARDSARQEVDLIDAEIVAAKKALNKANNAVDGARGKLLTASGVNTWSLVETELLPVAVDGKTTELQKALKHFGYEGPLQSAQTIFDVVTRFRSVGGRARGLLASLLVTRGGVVGAIGLVVVAAATAYAATQFALPLVSIGTACATALAWLAERATRARKWLGVINSFDERLSRRRQEEESKKEREVAAARAELEQTRETLEFARRRVDNAEVRVARAKADLRKLTARDQMRRFVDERVTAQAYAKHLGLISMIRRDFEDLSDFMYRDQQPGEPRLVRRIEEELQEEIPTVERIILYVDDLDRCQPDRVVEVLEAIHLLLAFRLFVVVVAVDPRWVLESLRRRYPHLGRGGVLDSSREKPANDSTPSSIATTHDYLEKIFNIPFWVRPMGPNACKSLVSGYLGFSTDENNGADGSEQADEERFNDIFAEPSALQSSISERPPIEALEVTEKEAGDFTPTAQHRPSAATLKRVEYERMRAEQEIESVEVTPGEQKFIKKLAPFLGNSPRRIKRYANVYRLMKSGLTRREATIFAGPDISDDHRIVLVFLAVVTGAPTLAPQVFTKAFELRNDCAIDQLIEESGLNADSINQFETANAKGALQLLEEVDVTEERIVTWLPRVMRYAFRLTPVNVRTAEQSD